jgi:hypothetical protein
VPPLLWRLAWVTMRAMTAAPVVTLDSVEDPALSRDVVGLVVRERRRRPTRLRLTVLSAPGRLVDSERGPGLRVGTPCGVSLDVGPSRVEWFDGTVTALTLGSPADTPAVVVVEAQDALHRLRTPPRRRVWRDLTDGDIVTAVAGEHGLGADVDAGPTTYRLVRQSGVSDLDFLRARARAAARDLWTTGDTLHLGPPEGRSPGSVVLRWGRELLSARVRTDHPAGHDGVRTRVVGEADGSAAVRVGALVRLADVGGSVDGRGFRVVETRRVLDQRGLRTAFRAHAEE